jgi:uncharacterized membrane protein YfhO
MREVSGSVEVIDVSTDCLVIKANLKEPAILLITDAYSDGWKAKAFPESIQQEYDIMPANYILRAIPLKKGDHHFFIEYMPEGFKMGRWISSISAVIYLLALLWFFRPNIIKFQRFAK